VIPINKAIFTPVDSQHAGTNHSLTETPSTLLQLVRCIP
jgi:hypothetical protein